MQLSEVLPYAIGFLLSIAANVVWQFMSTRLPLPSASHSTGISGFWLARVTYKSISDFERYGYNVHRIEETGGRVKKYTEHVDTLAKHVRVVRGGGIFKSPTLSIYYYYAGKNSHETGVATFSISSTRSGEQILSGCFSQVKDLRGVPHTIHHDNHSWVQITMPVRRQWRRLFRNRYFRDFDDVSQFVATLPAHVREHLDC
jgi:hypothetical protein